MIKRFLSSTGAAYNTKVMIMSDERMPSSHKWEVKTHLSHYKSEICYKCGLIRSFFDTSETYLLPGSATQLYENDCNSQLIDSVLRE